MIEHNNILKEEEDGEIDINKIEGEVSDKQREDIYNLEGERADIPTEFQGTDFIDQANDKAGKKQKYEN